MRGRILIHPPGHPLLLGVYLLLSVVIAFLASTIVSHIIAITDGSIFYSMLVSLLILLSPILSFVNIVVWEVDLPGELEPVIEFVVVYGLPIPVPRITFRRKRMLIAVNVGGALIPVIVSLILVNLLIAVAGVEAFRAVVVSTLVTAIVTFATSRTVPGVGIVVPALVPPLISSLAAMLYFQGGVEAGIVAYTAGALGSLLGADVFRFLLDLRKIRAPLVSIGGAGVFDGIYLSAVLGFILAY